MESLGEIGGIILVDPRNGLRVGPQDVGFGVSQLLPIVTELLVSRDSLVSIEQPELHLHPRLQSELADLCIESVIRGRNQLLVETHSEHLILRLQRRIRQGAIPRELVSVLYVDPTSSGAARVEELRMDESGEFIDEWPEGFFEERFQEVLGN
jgi:predicted ATPase